LKESIVRGFLYVFFKQEANSEKNYYCLIRYGIKENLKGEKGSVLLFVKGLQRGDTLSLEILLL